MVLVPVPEVTVPSGVLVSTHVPVEGKLFNTTLPVGTLNDGCVIAPITGAAGVTGCAFIVPLPVECEVHPDALVTVKEYVPGTIPERVVLVPDPVLVVPPGDIVIVQIPDEGNPFNTILPVAAAQVVWVIVPIEGVDGVGGCVLITTSPEADEVHPGALVTVNM